MNFDHDISIVDCKCVFPFPSLAGVELWFNVLVNNISIMSLSDSVKQSK